MTPGGWRVWSRCWTGRPRYPSDTAETTPALRFSDAAAPPTGGSAAHGFAVRGGGEAGLALPPELAADVGRLAGDSGATHGHEAAAGGAQLLRTDAEQGAETGDVFGQS